MGILVGNKKRFIATILVICMCFVLTMIWSVFAYIRMSNNDYELNQSQIIADEFKMLYEQDRKTMTTLEPTLDETMTQILNTVGENVKNENAITVDYLESLSKNNKITGIWLIEGDKVIRLSSEGMVEKDASEWYKDRPKVDWDKKLEWLLKNEGSIWIDGFSKRQTPPHEYYKWAYMGLGYVPSLGGNIVLEIGLSVNDAYSLADIEDTVRENNITSKYIKDVKIEIPSPTDKKAVVKDDYQIKDGDNVETYVKATDFNGQATQIVVTTHLDQVQRENRGALLLAIGSSVFTILVLGVMLVYLGGKRRNI